MCSADIVKPDANNVLGDISTGEELPSEPAPLTDNEKKLNEILERVKDIQLTIASDKGRKLPPLAKPDDSKMNDERIKQLQVSRSIKDIVDNFVEFEYNSEEGYVICNLCVPEPRTSSTASTHRPADNGMFMYKSC